MNFGFVAGLEWKYRNFMATGKQAVDLIQNKSFRYLWKPIDEQCNFHRNDYILGSGNPDRTFQIAFRQFEKTGFVQQSIVLGLRGVAIFRLESVGGVDNHVLPPIDHHINLVQCKTLRQRSESVQKDSNSQQCFSSDLVDKLTFLQSPS